MGVDVVLGYGREALPYLPCPTLHRPPALHHHPPSIPPPSITRHTCPRSSCRVADPQQSRRPPARTAAQTEGPPRVKTVQLTPPPPPPQPSCCCAPAFPSRMSGGGCGCCPPHPHPRGAPGYCHAGPLLQPQPWLLPLATCCVNEGCQASPHCRGRPRPLPPQWGVESGGQACRQARGGAAC